MKYKLKAFSLIELLVLLTVVSCIIAAFAPVMTTMLKEEQYTSYADKKLGNLKTYCVSDFNEYCMLCEGDLRCILCERSCVPGTVLNNDKCICE